MKDSIQPADTRTHSSEVLIPIFPAVGLLVLVFVQHRKVILKYLIVAKSQSVESKGFCDPIFPLYSAATPQLFRFVRTFFNAIHVETLRYCIAIRAQPRPWHNYGYRAKNTQLRWPRTRPFINQTNQFQMEINQYLRTYWLWGFDKFLYLWSRWKASLFWE